MTPWEQFYQWAASQPVFVQVALGILLVVVGLPLAGWLITVALVAFSSLVLDFRTTMDVKSEKTFRVWPLFAAALVILLVAAVVFGLVTR